MTKTILLVDDQANLRKLVRTTLEDSRHRILESPGGREALATLQTERPDLLIVDWMMPEMTGIDLVKSLKNDKTTAKIPIIMLTAKGQEKDRDQAAALGIRHYLVKPFSPRELLEMVEGIFSGSSISHPVSAGEDPRLSAELERNPELAETQLFIYARDLKRAMDSERVKAMELAAANDRLKILDQLKTDFLVFISHELRTPLYGLSIVGLLDSRESSPEKLELLKAMKDSYDRLEAFVEKGLEYFRWLAVEQVVTSETQELVALAHEVADRIPDLRAPGVDFRIDPATESYLVRGNESNLGNVVWILIENAVKFSPRVKRIRVHLNASMEEVTLTVADRGVGFPPDMAEEFFRPLTIGNVMHHTRGTGLNLAIARAIVRAHGGDLRAESPGSGKGAAFITSYPRIFVDRDPGSVSVRS